MTDDKTVKTSMGPEVQEVLEKLGFSFRNIEGAQTELPPEVENVIYNKLAEADTEISEMEDISDYHKVIAHAIIFTINASLKLLYKNVLEDITDRVKKRMPKVELVTSIGKS